MKPQAFLFLLLFISLAIPSGCKSTEMGSEAKEGANATIISGVFINKGKTERVDLNSNGTGTITQIDSATGLMLGAHPTKIIVEWTGELSAKIFGTKNFVTGEKDLSSCGKEISFDSTKKTFVSPENGRACGDLFSDKFYIKAHDPIVGTFINRMKTERVDLNSNGTGTITQIDSATGLMLGAHPTKIIVEWTGDLSAKIFGTKNFVTGEKDLSSCGKEISFDSTKKTFVSPENGRACGDLFSDKFYTKAHDPIVGTFINRMKTERVDLNSNGTGTITQIDSATGLMLGAHPTKIIVEWTGELSAKIFGTKNFVTGEKDLSSCGKEISFDSTKKTFVSPENGRACGDLFSDKFYSEE